MRRLGVLLTILAAGFGGCLGGPSDEQPSPPGGDDADAPFFATFWLKPGFSISAEPPASAAPRAVALPPGQNAYVNEDLDVFRSGPVGGHMRVTEARLIVSYEVTQPVVDPFVTGNPPNGRLFVFWLGSEGVLPLYAQTYDSAVLVPGAVYQRQVDLPVPGGGLYVGGNRTLDLLAIATASQQEDVLRLLVDHPSTPSRIQFNAVNMTDPAVGEPLEVLNKTVTIPGNTGLFTGATAGPDSQHRETLRIPNGTRYVRIDVRFLETTGPKADLDLWLEDANGKAVASSTTPFQSESIELWPDQAQPLSGADYAIVVNAYSGMDTRFDLVAWLA